MSCFSLISSTCSCGQLVDWSVRFHDCSMEVLTLRPQWTCSPSSPSADQTSSPSVRPSHHLTFPSYPNSGDLGVQRGLLRWILALHSPSTHDIQISPRKLPKQPDDQPDATPKAPASTQTAAATADDDVLPALPGATLADASSVPPAPIPEDAEVPKTAARGRGRANAKGRGKGKGEDAEKAAEDADEEAAGVLPTPFTPSINKVLNAVAQTMDVPPLPAGLTVSNLRTRLDTKKKIK